MTSPTRALSLFHLLDPEVLADPYPLYALLRRESPVLWDRFLGAWVVTRYDYVEEVLTRFRAERTPTPDRLIKLGMQRLAPVAEIMVNQVIFMDPPQHRRVRGFMLSAFTARSVERLRGHVHDIANELVDRVIRRGEMDLMGDFANPLPAIVTAEMLGVPTEDHEQLREWSQEFGQMLGNFQHNPDNIDGVLKSVSEMTPYFRDALYAGTPSEGLIGALSHARVNGDRLTDDEVVANAIMAMVAGLETTTNLIGNGLLTLLRHPAELEELRADLSALPAAVEELVRYESPSQLTARIAPENAVVGGQRIQEGQAVIAVVGAANRDPDRFSDPDKLDLARAGNRHLGFGWGEHFCFGAPLARLEAHIAFETLLSRLDGLELAVGAPQWRATNLGLRGLESLPIRWRS
ncbi:MAG TPA: cytochrome P450 [Mycobacterium sp.]|nr:cytochrome P450 [Mycobacterium sp.]